MSPYRIAAPPAAATGWTARRDNLVYGEQVVSYTWHRWYWTAYLRAVLWIFFHGLGRCSFRRGRWTTDD